jgi:hypothetical protein
MEERVGEGIGIEMLAPKRLEILFGLLLPPASREHVLGDLRERYRSPLSYAIDAISVLGPVIVSRIRRTTDLQIFSTEALTVYLSFMTTSWYLGNREFLYEHGGFVRLILPTAIAAIALLFCNAYSDWTKRSFSRPVWQSAGSLSLALLWQSGVFNANASLAVPFRTLLYGSLLSLALVSQIRILFPPLERQAKVAYVRDDPPATVRQGVRLTSGREFRSWVSAFQIRTKSNSARVILAASVAFFLLALLKFPRSKVAILLGIVLIGVFRICMDE